MVPKPIKIVGGGLAGLTLGIGLRLHGVPVSLWESGRYPRHRVCGEVLSGRGCDVLDRLGLLAPVLEAGARPAQTAAFFAAGKRTPLHNLPSSALCVARYSLDHVLAKRFRDLGGELREGQRWTERTFPPGVVRASGRPVQSAESGWRWFGLKAHFRNLDLTADVEMHLLGSGYVGLCRLAGGRINVCGLFRRPGESRESSRSWLDWLHGAPGSLLHERLSRSQWDEGTLCAVAGLPLRPRRAAEADEFRVGDSLTMISPVSGNGMSMAMEAAELGVSALTAYSQGRLSWADARANVAEACDARFARRLRWASWLHRALFHRAGRACILLGGQSHWAWRTVFGLTR